MAAPTPVSALVHSSTLVTAGVYLLIRFSPVLEVLNFKLVLFFSGIFTIMISRLGALYEIDLKKIIALSTLRQLGLIIMSLGVGYYLLAFFHLLTHALFKASLFLCAGRIIHSFRGRQDLRDLNGVTSVMPTTSSCLLVCSLSLSGFPFLSAFFSKDKIIEESLRAGGNFLWLMMLVVSILLTALYSFRLIFYVRYERRAVSFNNISDSKMITKRIIILTLGGIIGGSFISWVLFDSSYDNLLFFYKRLIILFMLSGIVLGVYIKFNKLSILSFYLSAIWFLVSLSTKFMSSLGLSYGKYVLKR